MDLEAPLRSFLFVPADSERKLAAAARGDADALIIDLEDSVAAERKPAARKMAVSFLKTSRPTDRPRFVRINGYDAGLALEDLCAVMPARPDGIVLPKCNGTDDVRRLDLYLQAFEAQHCYPLGSTLTIPIVTETAQGVVALGSYGRRPPRVCSFMWGAEDLSGQIGAARTKEGRLYRDPFKWVRQAFLFACHAAEVGAIDAVFVDISDLCGLEDESTEARLDGFSGKVAIHPSQCDVINRSFTPTESEVAWAREVLKLLEGSESGVATLGGQMIDRPHQIRAEKILHASTYRRS